MHISSKNKSNFLNPKAVVEFARNPKTKLHSKFEWDDTKAAHEHRLEQARRVIRLEFQVIEVAGEKREEKMFFSIIEDRHVSGGYRLVDDIMKESDLREKLINQVLSELIRIKNKYKELHELAKIFEAIETLEKKEMVANL